MKKHDKKSESVQCPSAKIEGLEKVPDLTVNPKVEMMESEQKPDPTPCLDVKKERPERKPKTKRSCCVKGCSQKNRNIGIHSYNFPSDTIEWKRERRRKWIEAVIKHNKLDDEWEPSKNHRICSAHFAGGKRNEHPLHPAYNPTIFPGQSSVKANRAAARFQRCLNRSLNKPTGPNKFHPDYKKAKPLLQLKTNKILQNQQQSKTEEKDDNVKKVSKSDSQFCKFRDFECQVLLHTLLDESQNNFLMCNLKTESGINYAETQTVLHRIIPRSSTKNSMGEMKLFKNLFVHNVEFIGISSIRFDHELLELSGVTFTIFNHLLKKLPDSETDHVSKANKLLIFLMILKQGINISVAAALFQLPRDMVRKLFANVLLGLAISLKRNIRWPETGGYLFNEPLIKLYPNFKAILTCTEIQIEVPSRVDLEEYVNNTTADCGTFKVLLSHCPNGFVSYTSECFDGIKNLEFIVERSNFLNQIQCDNIILASDNFLIAKDVIESKQAHLITFSCTEDSVKAYIRNCDWAMKRFRILSYLPLELKMCINDIILVCCSLINLHILFDVGKNKNMTKCY